MKLTIPKAPGQKIRIVLVGCGRIAKNHAEAIQKFPEDLQLAGCVDVDPSAKAAFEAAWGAQGFNSLAEALSSGRFDVAVLCTPSGLHPKQAIECANAGLHVITEKPMSCTWSEGLQMVEACDSAKVHLFVVKQNRLNPTIAKLKSAVDAGRFGRIHMIQANVFWTRPQSYYDAAKWRGTWEWDGGAFMNQASHYIDLLRWLGGPVESCFAYTATQERKIEAEDSGVLSLKYRSGAMGVAAVNMLTYPKNLEGSITIMGETGTARVGGLALNQVLEWSFKVPTEEDASVNSTSYSTDSVYGVGHPLYYKNVIDVFCGKSLPATDGREGLKSLELLIAAYESAKQRRAISLPLSREVNV